MLGNIPMLLQQLAQGLTTGVFVTAVLTIGLAAVGIMWALGRLSIMGLIAVVGGGAILVSAPVIAASFGGG